MSGYTPSEEDVRAAFAWVARTSGAEFNRRYKERAAEFNRFLAEDRRKTAARALREAASDYQKSWPVYPDSWLINRADCIEKGATDDQS